MLMNIRIVLVETSHPGNIGAVARAMKTMSLEQLYLVNPQQYPHAEATARASGADDVLAGAVVCGSLAEAVEDCGMVIGASARLRSLAWPQLDPRECAEKVMAHRADEACALVFGRERNGLTNHELEKCHYLVHIPANEHYRSLNLAAAVQILAYELFYAQYVSEPRSGEPTARPLATAQDLALFYEHFERTMIELEFLDPENPRQLMRRVKRLFNRAQLEPMELNILRGMLTAVNRLTSKD